MRKLFLLVFLYVLPVNANIVPNFVQGNMQSTTNTTSTITESITSTDYFGNSYEYTVTGTTSGQSYNYTGLDLSNTNKPQFTLVNPTSGNSFQFTETYRGPGGISNITSITRQIETESVITTTSVFSQ